MVPAMDFHQLNLPDCGCYHRYCPQSTAPKPQTVTCGMDHSPRVEHYEIDCLHAQSYCRITNATQECMTRHLKEKVT